MKLDGVTPRRLRAIEIYLSKGAIRTLEQTIEWHGTTASL